MDTNRSVNPYFSETLCIMHAKTHIHVNTNSPSVPTQRNYIQSPQSNRLSHALRLLYMLFPFAQNISTNLPLSLLSLLPSSGQMQANLHFPLKTNLLETLQRSLSLRLSPIATTLSTVAFPVLLNHIIPIIIKFITQIYFYLSILQYSSPTRPFHL